MVYELVDLDCFGLKVNLEVVLVGFEVEVRTAHSLLVAAVVFGTGAGAGAGAGNGNGVVVPEPGLGLEFGLELEPV